MQYNAHMTALSPNNHHTSGVQQNMNPNTHELKPCPFCGKAVDITDPDTLHPNGTGWKVHDDGNISYHPAWDLPRDQWCWSLHCDATTGGCGVEMSADTQQTVINKWNRRT